MQVEAVTALHRKCAFEDDPQATAAVTADVKALVGDLVAGTASVPAAAYVNTWFHVITPSGQSSPSVQDRSPCATATLN